MNTIFLLAFWLFLAGAVAIGWRAGDRGDRQVLIAIAAAALASAAAYLLVGKPLALALIVVIDLALLGIVLRYALASRRYWPIWFAGFQGAICFLDLAIVLLPAPALRLDLMSGFWALATLVAMTAGLLKDYRAGL